MRNWNTQCPLKILISKLINQAESDVINQLFGRTVLTQTARINVTAFPLLNNLLERIWIGQYESTVSKVLPCTLVFSTTRSWSDVNLIAMQGREGIEFVANKITEEQKSV